MLSEKRAHVRVELYIKNCLLTLVGVTINTDEEAGYIFIDFMTSWLYEVIKM